jgi:hypothetical protein
MFVDIEIQVLAHDKQVKQLLMHDLKILDPLPSAWFVDSEGQFDWLIGPRGGWLHSQIKRILDKLFDTYDEFHPAPTATPRKLRANVGIHRANIVERFRPN